MNDIGLPSKDEDVEKAAKALKAMTHPLRLKILCILKNNLKSGNKLSPRNPMFPSILIFLDLKILLNHDAKVIKYCVK